MERTPNHVPKEEPPIPGNQGRPGPPALERHYSIQEIASLWRVSPDTARRLFEDEPGVIEVGQQRRARKRKSYRTLRVPQSVVERVHHRCSFTG
jgi:hypothetical protein